MYGSGLDLSSCDSWRKEEQSKALGLKYQLLIKRQENTIVDNNNM